MSYEGDLVASYDAAHKRLINGHTGRETYSSYPRQPPATKNELQAATTRIEAIENRLATVEKGFSEYEKEKTDYAQFIQVPELTVNDVFQLVRKKEEYKVELLLGTRRNPEIAMVRHIIFYLAATKTNRSYPQIGKFMRKDHSSIIHGKQRIEAERQKDPILNAKLIWFENELDKLEKAKAQAYLDKYYQIAQNVVDKEDKPEVLLTELAN